MAKLIHTMIRVRDLDRSVRFYADAFAMKESHRLEFPDFALVYLRGDESEAEIELTLNRDREAPYGHGDGYGHVAFTVEDLDEAWKRMNSLALQPAPIKEFRDDGTLLARFFFVTDPDGYKIEVLARHGHYQ